jgi:hypothetical protein
MTDNDLDPTSDPLVMRDRSGNRYAERPCWGCGELAWMMKVSRFCSLTCAARNQDHRGKAGDDVGYQGRHWRVNQIRGKADHCIHRASGHCTSTTYQWAQIKGTSGFDIYDYVPLCRSCHARYDYKGGRKGKGKGISRPSMQGSKAPTAKLNEAIVSEVRSRPVSYGSYVAWAREFNVDPAAMQRAVKGETYKNVPMPEGVLA